MKRIVLGLVAAVVPPTVAYVLLRWPLLTVIEFDARGERGDELIRVTEGDAERLLVHDAQAGQKWQRYRFERFGDADRIRICLLNQDRPAEGLHLLGISEELGFVNSIETATRLDG